jgi:hypothetical protein
MKNQGFASTFAILVLSSCILEGYSLPQAALPRYSVEEYGRKFGAAPIDNLSNDLVESDKPLAKEEGSMLTTVLELAMKFVPMLIDTLSGSTGPSQTDRIEGIDLNGEDPFSMRNIAFLGLKLFLAIAGGSSSGIDKSDNIGPMQPLMGAVIGALTGSKDPREVEVMAKQASEVINLVITLVEALTTSMSQRSFDY